MDTSSYRWPICWTEHGAEIASCLYSIIDEFELVDDDMFVREFDLAAHGIASDGNVGSEIEISERDAVTWRMVVSELGLWDGNNNGLFALVHIVDGWAPYG